MENPENLFTLVSRLSRGEKRTFRQLSKVQEGKKDYVELFDLLSQMQKFDAEKLGKTFPGKKSPQHYYNLKNYLFKSVLKSLNYGYNGPGATIENNFRFARILKEKGMFATAERALTKGLEQARQEERFNLCLEGAELYFNLLRETENLKHFREKLAELQTFSQDFLLLLENYLAYQQLFHQFYVFSKTKFIARGEIDWSPLQELQENPLICDYSLALSVRAKYFFHRLKYGIALFSGRYDLAMEHGKAINQLFQTNSFLRKEGFSQYITNISNLGQLAIARGALPYVEQIMAQLEEIRTKTPEGKLEVQEKAGMVKLQMAIERADRKMGEAALLDLEKALESPKSSIKESKRLQIFYQIAVYLLVSGQPEKAANWTKKILEGRRTGLRSDLQSFARILNLFICYELDDPDLLEYYSQSTYRYLYTRNRLYKYEERVLKFIRKAPFQPSKKALRDLFKEEIRALETLFEDPYEQRASHYFDTITWIKSKLENRPMFELIREKNSRQNPKNQ